ERKSCCRIAYLDGVFRIRTLLGRSKTVWLVLEFFRYALMVMSCSRYRNVFLIKLAVESTPTGLRTVVSTVLKRHLSLKSLLLRLLTPWIRHWERPPSTFSA